MRYKIVVNVGIWQNGIRYDEHMTNMLNELLDENEGWELEQVIDCSESIMKCLLIKKEQPNER